MDWKEVCDMLHVVEKTQGHNVLQPLAQAALAKLTEEAATVKQAQEAAKAKEQEEADHAAPEAAPEEESDNGKRRF